MKKPAHNNVYNSILVLCVLIKPYEFSSCSFSFANLVAKSKQRAKHEHVLCQKVQTPYALNNQSQQF